jgi:hypothetical protein
VVARVTRKEIARGLNRKMKTGTPTTREIKAPLKSLQARPGSFSRARVTSHSPKTTTAQPQEIRMINSMELILRIIS